MKPISTEIEASTLGQRSMKNGGGVTQKTKCGREEMAYSRTMSCRSPSFDDLPGRQYS